MATNSEEGQHKCSSDVIKALAGDYERVSNQKIIAKLEKFIEDVNGKCTRVELDNLLQDININLENIGKCKVGLKADSLSISTAGDVVVRAVKKARTVPGQLLYSKEDTKVEEGKVVSQYQLDGMHLKAEPGKCYEELSEIRDLILRCIRLHTELYLMGQEFDKLIQNIKLLKIDIPLLSEEKDNIVNLSTLEAFYQGFSCSNKGLIVGTLGGLVIGVVISGFLLNYLSCATCLQAIGKALLFQGCTSCVFKCGSVLVISGFAFSLCSLVGLMAGVTFGIGSDRRKVFEDLHRFRIELESNNIKPDLRTMCEKLESVKEGLQTDLNGTPNGSKSILELNIIMKAYRDYRVMYEESRADPDNQDMSDEQLHITVRKFGASACIKPITDRLQNFSKSEAWELIDAIHRMVIRE